ncbi:class I SAM-dependent RNA methyltransferase [Palleronia sediminis]|uniref:Class I SAM-dependent RNA methyltransferase n=1 Tax=Palleronia sediminis TaxID=2547833 RepID=A0A4V3BAV4_9RHOB|nr:class I SAM-dependent RNA methyltransferase [Palleronia sediminis]TDL84289.1 class I SAM-dependent RNA methyltransferase [Palleronia sediminis]
MSDSFPLFLVCPPGLEPFLAAEARALGLPDPREVPGGVETQGGWPEIARANLWLRGATRVLLRLAEFRALHLAQLDKRARRVDWGAVLRPDIPVRVEASCHRSRIYHDRAAAGRVARAITETLGAPVAAEAAVVVKLRIDDDLATISLDTTGESLHKRGHKLDAGKAPLRETTAALLLGACGFDGTETVVDPMCGSGTIPIEAASIAAGLAPGRDRGFAFHDFAGFDADGWAATLTDLSPRPTDLRFHGSDRDSGAVARAAANATRAGVGDIAQFARAAISDAAPPEGPPGLLLTNPPYGARIGDRKLLFGLYGAFGDVLRARFRGWRVGFVTSDAGLARATGLDLREGPQFRHGGLSIRLYHARP